jgi:pyroglutamyl-peptidase
MLTLLVTGFGAFPGASQNPTVDLIDALRRRQVRFARFGLRLELRILPVLYDGLRSLLAKLREETAPDAILHFGLASRRTCVSIETRARNRVNPALLDAGGHYAKGLSLVPGGPAMLKARIPTRQIVRTLRGAGINGRLSDDVGDYICNAAFYYSLIGSRSLPVGFVHIPRPARRGSSRSSPKPDFAHLVKAAEIIILDAAILARTRRASDGE